MGGKESAGALLLTKYGGKVCVIQEGRSCRLHTAKARKMPIDSNRSPHFSSRRA